jgi:hypothetical protein
MEDIWHINLIKIKKFQIHCYKQGWVPCLLYSQ